MRERSQEYKEEISKEENCVYEITPRKGVESDTAGLLVSSE
jgi:hypothetical protein